MNTEQAKAAVTEVAVSASEKKQLDQYEPAEATVGFTATVPEGVDAVELRQELSDMATEQAKAQVLARWEEYIRQDMDDE